MTTTFPTTVDALARPGATTLTNDTGYELDLVLDSISDAIEATETEALLRTVQEITINGNYDHWQRSEGASVTNTTTYNTFTSYGPDAWFTLPAGASVTTARDTTVPDNRSQYSALITGATSATTVDHGHRIGTRRVLRQAKRSLVFSAYVYNNTGASITPNLRVGTPGAADDFTTVTNRLDQALQACGNAAWTRVYHSFDPSAYTNINNGLEVALRFASGTLNAGTKSVRVAQVSLVPGTARSAYVPPDPDLELRRCLTRFCKTFPTGTAVAQNSGTGNGALQYVVKVTASPDAVWWQYPAVLQKTPTITTYNPSAANAKWRNLTDNADSDTPTVVNISTGSALVYNQAVAGDTAGDRVYVHATANAEY